MTRLLVTGSGRSGTMWLATALRAAGVRCGHERAFTAQHHDINGGWIAEVSAYAAPYTPMPNTYVVHLVRDPILTISSITHRGGPLRRSDYSARFFPELATIADRVECSARYWVLWNGCVVADEVVRLEDVTPQTVRRLARLVGIGSDPVLPPPKNAARNGPPRRIRWSEIRHVSGVTETARRYGYNVR